MKAVVTTLAFCVAALLALGMVMLYSSSSSMIQHGVRVGANYLIMQMIWCVLGLVACVVATSLDYRLLKKIVWPLFALAVILLVLVLLPLPHGLTKKINGAHRWFILPGLRLQPSELGKLALIFALAWYGDIRKWDMNTWWRGLVVPALIALPILGLIFIEPDRGTTILLAGVSGIMLLLAGVNLKHVVLPVFFGIVALGVALAYDPMRLARLRSWWDLEGTKTGVGFQGYQSILALGSGGWTGQGLGNGRQKLGWVPEHHTDFIFAIIGEELGLVATLLVVVAFLVILLCGLYIALRAPDRFGLLLGCGVTFLIGLQAFINIGVVTGALPNKGLPLPFISYGGSNLLAMLACIGLLFSIARRARESDTAREPLISGEIPQPA
jgi:cell division protein FtsW